MLTQIQTQSSLPMSWEHDLPESQNTGVEWCQLIPTEVSVPPVYQFCTEQGQACVQPGASETGTPHGI